MLNRVIQFGAVLAVAISLTACSSASERQALRVGFVPSENMQDVMQNAQPIVDRLQKELGVEVQPFVATDYAGVVEALRSKKLDIAFMNPAAYVLAKEEANVRVVLKSVRKGSSDFFGAIITRADSGINTVADLKDRTFAFGDPISTSGHIYPKKVFKQHGLEPSRDFKHVVFAGGHDATVLAVYNGKADAGATYSNNTIGTDGSWHLYLKKPEEQAKIKAIAYTEPIPADNLVVQPDMDPELEKKVVKVFTGLNDSEEGRQWLRDIYRIDGFSPATDADYVGVRQAFVEAGLSIKNVTAEQP